MKRVQVAVVVAAMALLLGRMALGQALARSPQEQPSLVDQLLDAVHNGDAAAVEQLLAKGLSVDVRGKDGLTALIVAAASNKNDILEMLLNKGARVNLQDWQHLWRSRAPVYFGLPITNPQQCRQR